MTDPEKIEEIRKALDDPAQLNAHDILVASYAHAALGAHGTFSTCLARDEAKRFVSHIVHARRRSQ